MTPVWSWDDVEGLDPETRRIATKAWALKPPLRPPVEAAPAQPFRVWSGRLGAWLALDGASWISEPIATMLAREGIGQWYADEAKRLASGFPADLAAAALPSRRCRNAA